MINKLCIVGVGLIGGSLAKALRAGGHVTEIVGYGRNLANLQTAADLGVIDYAEVSLGAAVRGADMVVLALPVGAMKDIFAELAQLSFDGVITDVGSTKVNVIAAARAALGNSFSRFVPGHPLAGTEQSGVQASQADLFRGRRVILTPEKETDSTALARVRAMWAATGAGVSEMSAEGHDRVLAASSHLPHLLAYALMDMIVRRDDHRAVFAAAAGGFRDVTRVAASDPVMWRDICLANRTELLAALTTYRDDLGALIEAIERGDGKWLEETFTRARRARETLNSK
ncbi:MAG: prephenate dehydrogenase/arogenate dehydrogenase family protein [Gammaproteobacteria bacterium]|nr:MAG: prephenate dehydrogenase/arogenate dehydrogenase family protein [Gammaproteobacteria bacterium]